jgi:histidyl-tRNA synthetase
MARSERERRHETLKTRNLVSNVVPPRGMRDMLPQHMALRASVIDAILNAYRQYGYQLIETPALESLRYLQSGDGGDNEKLIYKVLRRGLSDEDRASARSEDDLADLGLRYDLTVPLARFFASNRSQLPAPFRAIQIGPVWRAERPQRGRFRQFTQCDIDILGEAGELAETELVLATATALRSVGLTEGTIRINDRRVLTSMMAACGFDDADIPAALIQVDKIDKIGIDGVRAELEARWNGRLATRTGDLLHALVHPDTRSEVLRAHVTTEAGQAGLASLSRIMDLVREAGGSAPLTLELDPTLVRGMGYYTGPIFEVAHPAASGSIAGGGRYDGMIGRISGTETPACGFSIGFERILDLVDPEFGAQQRTVALLYDRTDLGAALDEAGRMRTAGGRVLMVTRVKNRRAQLDRLAAQGITEIIDFRVPS